MVFFNKPSSTLLLFAFLVFAHLFRSCPSLFLTWLNMLKLHSWRFKNPSFSLVKSNGLRPRWKLNAVVFPLYFIFNYTELSMAFKPSTAFPPLVTHSCSCWLLFMLRLSKGSSALATLTFWHTKSCSDPVCFGKSLKVQRVLKYGNEPLINCGVHMAWLASLYKWTNFSALSVVMRQRWIRRIALALVFRCIFNLFLWFSYSVDGNET